MAHKSSSLRLGVPFEQYTRRRRHRTGSPGRGGACAPDRPIPPPVPFTQYVYYCCRRRVSEKKNNNNNLRRDNTCYKAVAAAVV